MRCRILTAFGALVLIAGLFSFLSFRVYQDGQISYAQDEDSNTKAIELPRPRFDGQVSVEKALLNRRSIRTYKDEPLTLGDVSQILWAAQGITDSTSGKRTAPSARASYFLKLYLISGKVTDLSPGMYKYQPVGHKLVVMTKGDIKTKLFEAAGQVPIKNAPVVLLIAGDSERSRKPEWMYLEAGHAAQNVYLQAVSLNLGTVVMAGFEPDEVKKALVLPQNQTVIYIMPLGRKP
jgi:SagB-type dehydrogenase family enzyme